jgi:hypothetical protein
MQLHTEYSKHKELLQSCYWKLKVNLTYGADLAQWTVIFGLVTQNCEVTNCKARKFQRTYFCHDSFKIFAKMTQAVQGAVGLFDK